MGTIDLNLARAFVAVFEAGSFSGAAERLGVPRSTVSRAVAALEAALGVRLFHRTTRHVSASTAGAALHERVAPALAALDASLSDLPEREEEPSGTLRVTSTVDLGAMVLAEAAARFTARHPATRVEVQLSNTLVDLVRDGVDLALRVRATPLRDSSLVARKVGAIVIQLYASPAYLARRGAPRTPAELASHDWVVYRGASRLMLTAPTPDLRATIDARARIRCDDMFFAREAMKAGAGIGMLPTYLGDAEVTSGALARVMPRWVAMTGSVYVVHPGNKHLPRKVTAFRDVLIEQLRQRPLSSKSP